MEHEFNKFPNKETKKQAHLKVHVGMRSMGLGVLKEPIFIIPFKGWMVFFLHEKWEKKAYWKMVTLSMQRKRKFENGFHKMGV